MMKKKLFVLLTVVCILALATACGSQTSGTDTDSNAGTQSGAQQEESTLTGKLDEKKDFMFVVMTKALPTSFPSTPPQSRKDMMMLPWATSSL